MKLLPPEPDMILYETGFGKDDFFGRQLFGNQISSLISNIDDSFVLAIDGQWGSGKSFFLQRWVAHHATKSGNKHLTVYFDAFRHDFLEEPLVSLAQTVLDRFPNDKDNRSFLKKAREALAKIAAPVTRVGLAVATAGATEISGPIVDAALASGSKELSQQVEKFWAREAGKTAAMAEFKIALTELAASADNSKRLVVVVDELDRCRPDYALSVLEVIKHFFDIPNCVFVLGLNMNEMENIVRRRYGERVDATDYLRKFINITAKLPNTSNEHGRNKEYCLRYLSLAAKSMGIDKKFPEIVSRYLRRCLLRENISIRSVQRILSEMVLVPLDPKLTFEDLYVGYQEVISALIVMKVLNRNLYDTTIRGRLTMIQISEWLNLGQGSDDGEDAYDIRAIKIVFGSCLAPHQLQDSDNAKGIWGGWGLDNPTTKITEIAVKYVEPIQLLERD